MKTTFSVQAEFKWGGANQSLPTSLLIEKSDYVTRGLIK